MTLSDESEDVALGLELALVGRARARACSTHRLRRPLRRVWQPNAGASRPCAAAALIDQHARSSPSHRSPLNLDDEPSRSLPFGAAIGRVSFLPEVMEMPACAGQTWAQWSVCDGGLERATITAESSAAGAGRDESWRAPLACPDLRRPRI